MAGLSTGNAKAALVERGDDLYETPTVAVEALLREERLPHRIWEPACGPGAIVRILRASGHSVLATDLVDYGLEDSESRIDFLMERARPGIEAIVTNPPYKLASEFAAHALSVCPRVVMLLRLAFIEGQRRAPILERDLARVLVFSKRIPMMHRSGRGTATAKTESQAMAFAWFVWDRDHNGPTELRRISWDREAEESHGEKPKPARQEALEL